MAVDVYRAEATRNRVVVPRTEGPAVKVRNTAKVVGVAGIGVALMGVTATVSFAGTEKAATAETRTTRVSVSTAGEQANDGSFNWDSALERGTAPVVSNGGRFVTFLSEATNLVPGDTNGAVDVFVRDTQAGTTTRASIGAGGAQPDGESTDPSISADGRYVAFESDATNLVPGDTNKTGDVFVRDLAAGTTTRVSVADDEAQAEGPAAADAWLPRSDASISPDGRHVTFVSAAANLVTGDTNGETDIFVRDLDARTTTRVNVSSDGEQSFAGGICASPFPCGPRLSNVGRYVIFASSASNLVPGDTNGSQDIFVHDVVAGTTSRVNVSTESAQADRRHLSVWPTITSDGRYAFFTSSAPNLVPGDTNAAADLFRRDLVTGTTTLIKPMDGKGATFGLVSANGRYIGFASAGGDSFVRDLVTGVSTPVSVASDGTPGNDISGPAVLSPDGGVAVFTSFASNLVEGDTNSAQDVFLHELAGADPAGDIAGPTATFTLGATEVSAGQSVTLNQQKLTGGTGVERVVLWGDGSAPQTLAAGATTATHGYPTVGSYRVGVVLVDQAGNRTGAGMQGSSTVSVKAPTTR